MEIYKKIIDELHQQQSYPFRPVPQFEMNSQNQCENGQSTSGVEDQRSYPDTVFVTPNRMSDNATNRSDWSGYKANEKKEDNSKQRPEGPRTRLSPYFRSQSTGKAHPIQRSSPRVFTSTGKTSDVIGTPVPVIAEFRVQELVEKIVTQVGAQMKVNVLSNKNLCNVFLFLGPS